MNINEGRGTVNYKHMNCSYMYITLLSTINISWIDKQILDAENSSMSNVYYEAS